MGEWLFQLQLQISIAVVVILLLRQVMKKMPKVYSYLLWLLVFARLLVPVSLETRFSFIPSEQQRDMFVAEVLENFVVAEVQRNPGEDSGVAEGIGNATEDFTDAGVPGNLGDNFVGSQVVGSDSGADLEGGNIADHVMSGAEVSGMEGIGTENVTSGAEGLLSEGLTQGNGNVAGSKVSGEGVHTEVPQEATESSGAMWILVAVWAVGTALVLGYNGIALRKVRRSLQSARYLVDSVRLGKGNAPVYVCDKINTPFSLGFIKPVIYLPGELTADEQEYILCHERVHIGRKDNLVKHVAFLLTAIYWFNPFVWVAFFFMERDMEMSCDEKVLKIMGRDIKKNYSQSLLNFAEGRGKMPATHLTFGENSVKQRVKNVLSYKNAKKWTIAIGAMVLVVVVVALFTTRREESSENQGSEKESGQELTGNSGSLVQGEENPDSVDGSGGSGENQADDSQSSKNDTGASFADDVMDPIYVPAAEEALHKHCEKFMQENIEIAYNHFDYDELTGKAVIRHFVKENWWKKHVILEKVKIVEENDVYQVVQESLTDYSTIETNADFEALYGTPGLRNLNLFTYGENFYRYIMQQLRAGGTEAEYYTRFMDPVLAAVELLNLGEGSGVAKLEDGTIISGGGVGSVMSDGSGASGTTQGTLSRDAYFKEGTYAYVTYTFAKDGSTVEFPMRLVEESYGLWSVNVDLVREITQEPEDWMQRDMKERLGFKLEFTNFGIYRNADGVLTNIFPYYILPDLTWSEKDGILYFPIDAGHQEWDLDYWVNMICMLDLATGQFDKETLSLESLPDSQRLIQRVSAGSGLLYLYCGSSYQPGNNYVMPLINTGNTPLATGYTYNGKAMKDLTEAEQDAYGVALREEILKSGEVKNLSNRTMTETYAYVDLDGDGKTEKIVLSADTASEEYQYVSFPYDCFRLQVGDSVLAGMKEHLENELRFFSPDGKNIVIALFGDGPSDDYTTMLYLYKDSELRKIGEVQSEWTNIVVNQVENIFYVQDAHHDFIQPVWLWEAWKINEYGQVEEVPQETYDMVYGKFELPDLLVPLPVYESPGSGEVTYIQPQKVDFIKMDSTFRWVYVEAADGTSGWFGLEVEHPAEGGVHVRIKGLDLKHSEVFTTYYAG